MAEVPKWTIELTGDAAATAPWKTIVTREATLVSDGTAVTVASVTNATARTSRVHEALQKGVVTVINDRAAGN
jgi:hypothetical protein